ncbi:MAG: protoporphyrinogen/coproporphyrinogen oxidase, partial [Nitriliruptoraceae bacterium]
MPAPRQAVVVGAGIAGLVWALEAASRGFEVTVLEASERAGGAIRRGRVGDPGVAAELGAEAFAVARPTVLELVDELGLAASVVRPATHQAHLATRTGVLPLPTGYLGIPVDLADVARLLGEPVAAEAAGRDAVPIGPDTPLPATLGALVSERLGPEVAAQLVDPVVAGVHATPAREAELTSVAPPLADALRRHGGLMAA